jgi:hypothetical protein
MIVRIVTRFAIACTGLVAFSWIFAPSVYAEIDPDTIRGLWLLDKGKGKEAKDSSGNERHGTFTGSPKWREGKFGFSVEFPGAGDTVKIEGFGQEFPAEEVTITSWVKLEGFKNQDLFSLEPLDPSRVTVHFPWDNQLHWQFSTIWMHPPLPIGEEVEGKWQHWAFIHSIADNVMLAYQDGEVVGESQNSKAYAPRAGDFHIGGRLGSSFQGFVDEVGLFEAVLSQADVKSIMDNGLEARVFAVSPASKLSTSWGRIKELRE